MSFEVEIQEQCKLRIKYESVKRTQNNDNNYMRQLLNKLIRLQVRIYCV